MRNLLMTNVGRLRLIGLLEGISLLLLVGTAVPAKHLYGNPELVRVVGSKIQGSFWSGAP